MDRTLHPATNPVWDLPNNLAPEEPGCGLPTADLLGWAQSVTLTTEQLSGLQGAGVTKLEFPVENEQFQLNRGLFEQIADRVRSLNAELELGASFHESQEGSVSQTVWQEREIHTDHPFSRQRQYIEYKMGVRSSTHQRMKIAIGALVCAFRVKKDAVGTATPRHSWCCYDFGLYENVPQTWIDTRNTILDFGRAARWNLADFRSAFEGRGLFLQHLPKRP
jgi:hypothetical protein